MAQGDEKDNPFDLKPMIDYVRPSETQNQVRSSNLSKGVKELQTDTYFTLSKKGITSYINGKLEDYEPLQDWILARSNFKIISNYSFFKNFRRWKIIKKWHRNIIHKRREEIKLAL